MKTAQVLVSGAAVTDGFGAAVTGASFTLTNNDTTDGLGHLATALNNSITDHSGITLAFVGTDENGDPQTETITGPGVTATVTTTKYFKTVTSVTPSATIGADTFDIGWAVGSRGAHYHPTTNGIAPFNIGIGCTVVTGSPNYSIVYSFDKSAWFTHATITGKTASFSGGQTTPCAAMAVQFTAAGSVTATYIQASDK